MSQDSTVINDGTGAAVLLGMNNALATLRSQSSGSAAPSSPVAYMFWADTATGKMKQRNAANNAWIERWDLGDGGLNATVTKVEFLLPGSFTWDKPTKGTIVKVQCWGGGAAGQSTIGQVGQGGGGGGYHEAWIFLSSLPSQVSIIVGSGGTSSGANGGDSVFGTGSYIVTAYGGKGTGDGGGPSASNITTCGDCYQGKRAFDFSDCCGTYMYAATGGDSFGGGGGKGYVAASGVILRGNPVPGGNSVWGGGGGGSGIIGIGSSPGGTSVHAGNGGAGGGSQYAAGGNGIAPSGGGGGSLQGTPGQGARGQIILTVF